ncbi:MAG TPA: hypothetical protein VIZ58_09050 [Thermoanaerobaculia bacterium]
MNRRRAGEIAAAALFFSAAAVLFTWPLAARMSRGMPDLFDDKLNAWIFHWDFHQFFRDPLRLFDANIFFPARYTLAFSENLFGAAIFGFPFFAAGASTLFTANLLMLLGMALSGISAWLLARYVTGDPAASLLAGVVYAFVPWRLAQLPHVQFQWGPFLALLLLFLLRYLDAGRRRDLVLFGVFFDWNAVTNVHYAMFSGLLVLLVLAHGALARDRETFRSRWKGAAIAIALAGVAVLPFYVPYAKVSKIYGMVRGEGEIDHFSGRPVDFLTAGPQNKLYAPLTQKWAHAEGDFFPGLVPLGLAAFALVRLRGSRPPAAPAAPRRRSRAVPLLDAVAALGLALWGAVRLMGRESIGPVHLRDPGRILVFVVALVLVRILLRFPARSRYANLADFARRSRVPREALLFAAIGCLGVFVAFGSHTPFYRFLVQSMGSVFRSIRVPGRGIVLFDLALGILAAWGLSIAARGGSRSTRNLLAAGALALTTFEYRAFPIEIPAVERDAAPVYGWLAGVPLRGAAVEWPITDDIEPEHVFRSTAHWKLLVNGYSGFGPPHYHALTALLAQPRIPDAVWEEMRRLGASVLLFHPTETTDENRRKYLDAVRRGVTENKLTPLASFRRPGSEFPDFAFKLAGSPSFPVPVPPEAEIRDPSETIRAMRDYEFRLSPPFGVVERPRENEEVAAGSWGFGWALDDSGVASVTVSADGSPPVFAALHQEFPGVAAVYPNHPDSARPGFGFAVPMLPKGPQVLKVEITGRDGGRTVLQRPIVIR